MGTTAPVPWLTQALCLLPGPIRSELDRWSYGLAKRKAAGRAAAIAGARGTQPPVKAVREPRYPTWNE